MNTHAEISCFCCSYKGTNNSHCDASFEFPLKGCRQNANLAGAKKFKFGKVPSNKCGKKSCNDNEECEGDNIKLRAALGDFTVTAVRDNIHVDWNTISEKDNNAMNIYCAQMEDGKFKDITKFNKKPMATKAFIPFTGASYSSNDYAWKDNKLASGVYYCVLEDINVDGMCTTHCDHISAAVVGKGKEQLNINLEDAKKLCKEHHDTLKKFKHSGLCIEELLNTN